MDNKILYTAKFTHHDLKFHKVWWKSDKRCGSRKVNQGINVNMTLIKYKVQHTTLIKNKVNMTLIRYKCHHTTLIKNEDVNFNMY